jgi:hypothetical protein
MVYGCDPAWWKHRKGLPEFTGLKVAWSGAQVDYPDLLRVEIAGTGRAYGNTMQFDQIGKVGGGGNSGFQALNLAAQLGANRILLVGFDMTDGAGAHWYGRNNWHMANNPDESAFRRWRPALDAAAPVLAARGVDVVNASPASALSGFRKASIDAALEQWGLA